MINILKREFISYFITPYAYIFLSTFLFFTGLLTYLQNIVNQDPHYSETILSIIHLILLPLIPLLTMKSFTDDKKQNTDQLLYTVPISIVSIVIGKYLAIVLLFFVTICITFIYPIIYSFYSFIDWGHIIGSYIGLLFLASTYIAIGIFISVHTDNPFSSAISTFIILCCFLLLDVIDRVIPQNKIVGLITLILLFLGILYWFYSKSRNILYTVVLALTFLLIVLFVSFLFSSFLPTFLHKGIIMISILKHYRNFPQGVISIDDVVYYLSIIFYILTATTLKVESKRWV